MKRIYIYAAALLLTAASETKAFDFTVDGRHYTITSPTTVTLEQIEKVGTEVTVNATVEYEGHQLTVTAIGGGLLYTDRSVVQRVTLPETIETIGNRVFLSCESLRQINLPNGLRVIRDEAFNSCPHLQIDIWPDSLQTIGEDAFAGCLALKDVVLPAKLTTIGRDAFAYSGITSISLKSSAVTIGEGAFRNCKSLKSFTLDGNIMSGIPGRMFWNSPALESAEFRGDIVARNQEISFQANIGREAFSGCTALSNAVIPKNVAFIGSDAFFDCSSLESIDLGAQVKDMEPEVFMNSGLKSIRLPETLTLMGTATFSGCMHLESLTLPLRLERVLGIVDGTTGLKRLELKSRKPLEMNPDEFAELYDRTTLVVPAGSKDIYAQHKGWGQFKQIEEAAPTVYTFYADIYVKGVGCLLWNDKVCTGKERIEVTEGDTVKIKQVPYAEIDSLAWINLNHGENFRLHRDSVYTLIVDGDISLHVSYSTLTTEPERVHVTLRQADLGVVRLAVLKGKSVEFTVNPDEGWTVNCVTLNGEDISDKLSDYRILTTGPLEKDAEISIAFEKGVPDGIANMASSPLRVRAYSGTLNIDQAEPGGIDIFTVDGRKVAHLPTILPTVSIKLPVGKVYIIKNGTRTFKVKI